MSETEAAAADRALEAALEATGARDPREFYRERLRELKRVDPDAYDESVRYYGETLIPEVASGTNDPLAAWTEYGRRLAAALAPGRPVSIDETGRARPFERPEPNALVLHVPDHVGSRAILVGLPPTLSDAQRAAYDVLVAGKQRTSGGD
jgi:hypothetical protein